MIIKNLKKPKYPSVDEHINTWGYIHTYIHTMKYQCNITWK